MDAESAHDVTLRALRSIGKLRGVGQPLLHEVELAGLRFPNRVGLAAGFDTNGIAITGLTRLGFGFLEVGAVTLRPQQGNPKPRLFRLSDDHAVINRMGFNNAGVESLGIQLSQTPDVRPVLLGINLGLNRDTPLDQAADDYRNCLERLFEFGDFFTINVSSPNTPHLRSLQNESRLEAFLRTLIDERSRLLGGSDRCVPLFVKVSPDLDPVLMRDLALRVKAVGCDGLIATNTTVERSGIHHRFGNQQGGLSGKPLLRWSLRGVENIRDAVGPSFPVIGVGGISSANDAIAMHKAGADLIQLYTALIYRGPNLVRELVTTLA